jgi:hypothetical protein
MLLNLREERAAFATRDFDPLLDRGQNSDGEADVDDRPVDRYDLP